LVGQACSPEPEPRDGKPSQGPRAMLTSSPLQEAPVLCQSSSTEGLSAIAFLRTCIFTLQEGFPNLYASGISAFLFLKCPIILLEMVDPFLLCSWLGQGASALWVCYPGPMNTYCFQLWLCNKQLTILINVLHRSGLLNSFLQIIFIVSLFSIWFWCLAFQQLHTDL